MNIILNYGSLYDIVARSLSIIGKRANDNNGNNLFGSVTLGTAEKNIVCDFFANAFTEICGAIDGFISSEVHTVSSFSSSAQIDFWTDQTPSTFNDAIIHSGQLLYRYNLRKLFLSSLSFPFAVYTTSATDVFKFGDNYYDNTLTLISEPTDEQKESAITLAYFGVDPETLSVEASDIYAGYNGGVYKSERQASFAETTPSATTIYYDPAGIAYRWEYEAMQITPGGIDDSIELVITTPDNWNSSLTLSFRQTLYNYCVSYALYSWFMVTAPNIAEKYLKDSQRQMMSALQMIHEKKAPATDGTSYSNVKGRVVDTTPVANIAVNASVAQTAGKYTLTKSTFLGYYTQAGNLTIECSDNNTPFVAKVGGVVVLSIKKTPYQLKASDISALTLMAGTNIEFVPSSTLDPSNILIIKHAI